TYGIPSLVLSASTPVQMGTRRGTPTVVTGLSWLNDFPLGGAHSSFPYEQVLVLYCEEDLSPGWGLLIPGITHWPPLVKEKAQKLQQALRDKMKIMKWYWQVEEGSSGEWAVEVCKEASPRNAIISTSLKDGTWRVQHWSDPLVRWEVEIRSRLAVF
ncbi:hypothetical protein J0S82_011604, partial [Galemys pyrenaicus]